ncbi:MAG: DNA repair protein RadA [Arenicella sp.]
MAKNKTIYVCNECGAQSPQWAGQCKDCGQWNTLEESTLERPVSGGTKSASRFSGFAPKAAVTAINQVKVSDVSRFTVGMNELDRVLGGGLVPGSIVLLGGDPGIGKSTLLLQCMSDLSQSLQTLYVTGEESTQQIAMRAKRLGKDNSQLQLLADNCIESLLAVVQLQKPQVLVVDSIQTLYTESLQSAPGSVAQVRETASLLVRFAKETNTIVVLVGHVTKEGNIAGPRVLEHMVDTVLYFEGDRSTSFRLVRAIKNRFGAVNEIGVFAMTDVGLKEVSNPSAMFIKREADNLVGSVILVTQEGTRPLLVEVQALVDQSLGANPRRVTVGLDQQRLAMLLAVLSRHAGYSLADQDVFVNVIGGVKVSEPAADLAILMAVLSSYKNKAISDRLAVFGEIGLTGEVRPVQRGIDRFNEAEKLGFETIVVPYANLNGLKQKKSKVIGVKTLEQAIDQVFNQ